MNVPNTLLKKDIRDIIVRPTQKVYAVISKKYMDGKYSVFDKVDKGIRIEECRFSDEIERLIDKV